MPLEAPLVPSFAIIPREKGARIVPVSIYGLLLPSAVDGRLPGILQM